MIRRLSPGLAALMSVLLTGPTLAAGPPLPFDLGGPFSLVDQTGTSRTQADPDGHAQLLFFGYANCRQICSSVLPQMAEVADALDAQGLTLRPVMITVDPLVDTVAAIGPALTRYHDDFVGLTGSEADLQAAYDAFGVEKEVLFEDPEYGPVFAHGSFLYLLDGEGQVLTLIPPVLADAQVVGIVAGYLEGAG